MTKNLFPLFLMLLVQISFAQEFPKAKNNCNYSKTRHFHSFHHDEYGNPEVEEEFKAMMHYSPFHNIKEEVNYPITLIVTSENDDRVPPIHSYKFAARLQNRLAQKNPIFLKTQRNSGHSGRISTYKNQLDETAEFYNFLLFHLNS